MMSENIYLYDTTELKLIDHYINIIDQLTAGFCGFSVTFLPLYTLIQYMR